MSKTRLPRWARSQKKGGGARTPESLEKRKKEGQWFVRQLYSQRWVRMHEMMDTGGAYTAPQFAQALGAPLRTIEDELKFMRGGLEMPIVYDRKRGGHCFTEEYVPMPGRRFDESDAMSFTLTRKLSLESLRAPNPQWVEIPWTGRILPGAERIRDTLR